jgi:hypothetical protein
MNPDKDVFETKWDVFLWKVLNWRNTRRNDQLIKVNSVRERSIGILQNRYGYTREQAIYQLDKYYPRTWLG